MFVEGVIVVEGECHVIDNYNIFGSRTNGKMYQCSA